MVSVSPRASANDTPFTAATSVPRRRKRTVRSSTRSTGGSVGMMSGMRAPSLLRCRQMAGDEMRPRVVASPSSGAASGGTSSAQIASAKAQRVRKRQPDGGLIGLGGSPVSGISVVRRSGSSVGFEANSARV